MSICSFLKTSLLLYSYLVGLSLLFYPIQLKRHWTITTQQHKSEPTMVSATLETPGKMEEWEFKKQGIGNEVTDRDRVQVRFCSHFSFFRFPILAPCSLFCVLVLSLGKGNKGTTGLTTIYLVWLVSALRMPVTAELVVDALFPPVMIFTFKLVSTTWY